MDNASFLISLTPELRAEVLLTADPTFLASLPPDLVAEAQLHRERAAAQWQRREMVASGANANAPAANSNRAGHRNAALQSDYQEVSDHEGIPSGFCRHQLVMHFVEVFMCDNCSN
jgi:hypothetical protein